MTDELSELDWNRLRSGDYRALNADHQDVFDMVKSLRDELGRLQLAITRAAEERPMSAMTRRHLRSLCSPDRDTV